MTSRYVHIDETRIAHFRSQYGVDSMTPFFLTPPLERKGELITAYTAEEARAYLREYHPHARLPSWRELLISQEIDPILPAWELTESTGHALDDIRDIRVMHLHEYGHDMRVAVPNKSGYMTKAGQLGFATELSGEESPFHVYQRVPGGNFVVMRHIVRGTDGFDSYLDMERDHAPFPAVIRGRIPAER